MPGAEISNVNSEFQLGALRFRDNLKQDIFVIGPTTGLSCGQQNQQSLNVTAAATLVPSTHGGYIVYATTDGLVLTLQTATATTFGECYTIVNTASSGAALLQIRTNATTDYMLGIGSGATSNCVAKNTKTTALRGDSITVQNGALLKWNVTNVVGTWAFAATT